MQTFNSIYLGIVVQNNDPEYRGRIKVWVPHVSTTIYNKWNQLKKDVTFGFPGQPGGEDLSSILGDLKDTLPWAEMCSPIAGASTANYYNAPTDTNTASDAPLFYGQPNTNYTTTSSATQIDPEGKGNKPGALYENYPVDDAFGNTAKINSQHLNRYSNNYKPSMYSNAAKGLFTIPNVGAHVWVFFRDGIPHYPVYMGTTFGQDEFKSIFKAGDDTYPDYPGTFENKDQRVQKDATIDSSTYRNKLVLNQRGAAIEIINTTDRESYKVSHFAGGYYELNNQFTALFNPKNFQLLTRADKFETVYGHSSSFVQRDFDSIVQGDHFLKVGNFNIEANSAWSDLYSKISGNTSASQIESSLAQLTNSFADQEKKMGFGGNSFGFITKHKVVTVGLNLNTADTYSILPFIPLKGKEIIGSVKPNLIDGYFAALPTGIPTVQQLYVPDMPGGNYDIFAMNRLNIKSGAGGSTIQSLGPVKAQGSFIDIRADAMINVGAKDGLIDISGDIVTISGNALQFKNLLGEQVVVDSTLGVTKNVVIGGGAYVEGELFVNHVTAPLEYQVTENTQIVATGPVINPTGLPGTPGSGWAVLNTDALGNLVLTIPSLPVLPGGGATEPTVVAVAINPGSFINLNTLGSGTLTIAQPHSHVFKNLPLRLENSSTVGPSPFSIHAANTIGTTQADKDGITAEAPLNGRIQTVGVPPPVEFSVGADGLPTNFPNGPGSIIVGPRLTPAT